MLLAILHFMPDDQDPAGIVATLADALSSGSYLVISHATADYADQATAGEAVSQWRPDSGHLLPAPSEVGYYGAVARKP